MIREFNNPELAPRNSFHVAQRAARLIEFDRTEDLQELFEKGMPDPWYVLGGGNNVLFTQDYPGTLLTPVAQGIRIVDEQPDCVTVEADAGVEWDDLVEWAVQHELWGLENLSLIPGKVGAAPVQNIGAYGCEAKDAIRSVEMFCTETFNTLVLNREHCAFGYRDSVFKRSLRGRVIITSVRFALSRTPRPRLEYGDLAAAVEARGGITLRNIREAISAIRRAKLPDPKVAGNAGSFFKNPVVDESVAQQLRASWLKKEKFPDVLSGKAKLAAGWLIDKAGLKGCRSGRVGIHERQALVLVNLGGATGGEILDFARMVQARVHEKFGIEIDTEVNIL